MPGPFAPVRSLRIQDILILGGGSAGFLAAITLKWRLPGCSVTVVRSPEIGIIGVGEGTTPILPRHLLGYLRLDPGEYHRQARPTWKLGIRFLWGPRRSFDFTFGPQVARRWDELSRPGGFYCHDDFDDADLFSALMARDRAFVRQPNGDPLIERNLGHHLENALFVAYLEGQAGRLGVRVLDATVTEAPRDERGITGLRLDSGEMMTADLYVDCSGFRSALIGQALGVPFQSFASTLFCDRSVVGGWARTVEPIKPYTTAETMDAGWCWQIEHEHRINRGYVYSSAFLSDDQAEREFREKNPSVEATRIVRFPSGRYRESWVGNAVAIGNASGFVEPLEATSLVLIAHESRLLAEVLTDCDGEINPSLVAFFNGEVGRGWDNIRRFLAIHYRFNDRLDTPFWRACRADVDLAGAEPLVEFYRENGPSLLARHAMVDPRDPFGFEAYLVLLIGQRVPYRRVHVPTPEERVAWDAIRAGYRLQASRGMTIAQALAAIRAPGWTWYPGYYHLDNAG